MNEPIVDPWLIYTVFHLLPAIKTVAAIHFVVGGIVWAALGIAWILEVHDGEEVPLVIRLIFLAGIAPIILSFLITVFVPPPKVLVTMLVAKHTTPATIEKLEKAGKRTWEEFKDLVERIAEHERAESTKTKFSKEKKNE